MEKVIEEKNSFLDFALDANMIMKVYPNYSKKTLSQIIWRCKHQLKKPKGGILLASEFCNIKGIRLDQLNDIIHRGAKIGHF